MSLSQTPPHYQACHAPPDYIDTKFALCGRDGEPNPASWVLRHSHSRLRLRLRLPLYLPLPLAFPFALPFAFPFAFPLRSFCLDRKYILAALATFSLSHKRLTYGPYPLKDWVPDVYLRGSCVGSFDTVNRGSLAGLVDEVEAAE